MQTKYALRRRGYKTRNERERVQRHLKHHEKNVSLKEKNFSHHGKGFHLKNSVPSLPFPLALECSSSPPSLTGRGPPA